MSFKEGNNISAVMKYGFDNMVLFSSISWGAVNLMWESFRRGAVSVFELLWATTFKGKKYTWSEESSVSNDFYSV